MSKKLFKSVKAIEDSIALMGYISDRLKYLQPDMKSLIDDIAAGSFSKLRYPQKCCELMESGLYFPASWRHALIEARGDLGEEEAAIIAPLANILGSADLESQISQLGYVQHALRERLASAVERQKKYTALYRNLGVLGGIAAVIMLA